MKDWLIRRLTPRKQGEARWTGLAGALQEVWEGYFDPALSRLERLRSYFSADDADLARRLREMGDYFAADLPKPEDRPIAVAWRRLELEYKDLELILTSVFRRHYSDLPVAWFPLFAPVEEEYGLRFIPAEGPWPESKNQPPDGMFLTSRGLLGVDYGHLLRLGLSKQAFMDSALPLLRRTKPLHIVYDGPLWYIRFDIPFDCLFAVAWERAEAVREMPFTVVGARFDLTPADARALDVNTMSLWGERAQRIKFDFLPRAAGAWRLDFFLPEGFPSGWTPLEAAITGHEGDSSSPLRLALLDVRHAHALSASAFTVSASTARGYAGLTATAAPAALGSVQEIRSRAAMPGFGPVAHRLDRFPRFDDIPADLFPLDLPIGGTYA